MSQPTDVPRMKDGTPDCEGGHMTKGKTIFVTKYALSEGAIREYEQDPDHVNDAKYMVVKDPKGLNGTSLFHGNDWHTTREEAIKRVEEMRRRKIASLKKQIKKLEQLRVS